MPTANLPDFYVVMHAEKARRERERRPTTVGEDEIREIAQGCGLGGELFCWIIFRALLEI